ncbi:hypothetical protein KEM55_000492, partial [Ascosphaera atra]
TIESIVNHWGVKNADVFASATLMRPYEGGTQSTTRRLQRNMPPENMSEKERSQHQYEMHKMARDAIRDMLGDETRWPQELIFITRNLRIVQGNNQFLGSPVNRIKSMGVWASRALVDAREIPRGERFKNWWRHLFFRCVLVWADVVFWACWVKQLFGFGRGMEDEIERQMQRMARDMGFELNHNLFEG